MEELRELRNKLWTFSERTFRGMDGSVRGIVNLDNVGKELLSAACTAGIYKAHDKFSGEILFLSAEEAAVEDLRAHCV
jgi:hypothetical protein